jgi:hypothetical protein
MKTTAEISAAAVVAAAVSMAAAAMSAATTVSATMGVGLPGAREEPEQDDQDRRRPFAC